jgi:hypothetical protein
MVAREGALNNPAPRSARGVESPDPMCGREGGRYKISHCQKIW